MTLKDIRAALEREIADPGKFHFINTRLILTTGVNLNQIAPGENTDQRRIARATDALVKMGILVNDAGATNDR